MTGGNEMKLFRMLWMGVFILMSCLPAACATPETAAPAPTFISPTAIPTRTPTAVPPTLAVIFPPTSIPEASGLVINEYLLDAPPDYSTERLKFVFANDDKEEVLAATENYRDFHRQILARNNEILQKFNYRQGGFKKEQYAGTGYFFWYYNLYHGSEKIISDAWFVESVSVNASGTNFITYVSAVGGDYVLTADGLEKRVWHQGRQPYVYVGDQLLYIEEISTAHQQGIISAYLDDRLAYETEMRPVSTYATFLGPWSYGEHWSLALLDAAKDAQNNWQPKERVILDGQDMNEQKGYEQSFQFSLVDGRPFYFYQRNGKIGISFDGVEIPKEYDEIPHYKCCSSALLNPGASMRMVWFFAHRGGEWFYVEAYVPR
jgi:hypothetical protein